MFAGRFTSDGTVCLTQSPGTSGSTSAGYDGSFTNYTIPINTFIPLEWQWLSSTTSGCADSGASSLYYAQGLRILNGAQLTDQDLFVHVVLSGQVGTSSNNPVATLLMLNVKRPGDGSLCVSAPLSQVRGQYRTDRPQVMYASLFIPNSCLVTDAIISIASSTGIQLNSLVGVDFFVATRY